MYPCVGFGYGLGWIFLLIIIVMILFCFFMMRRCGMSWWMGCWMRDKCGPHGKNTPPPSMTMEPPKEKMEETL